ncbi:uncharacterized protein LOC127701673 isoform X1 [Mytilus californianus]|uniref:uncharacterized protein LOC127701673 isoform X1 n=1 Tax=Mytilus californianus TaxID=6549 RepID=UPI0022471716|nr:uncharacterized protein LOC127701673 isoform X1 [Mytilus californianus]
MTENVSSTCSASSSKKRKSSSLFEESENSSSPQSYPNVVESSSPRSDSSDQTTSSEDQTKITSSPTEIDDCTSKWNKNTLNKIGIESVTTKAFDPMDLISFAFNLKDPKVLQRVDRCKKVIENHEIFGTEHKRHPYNVLDIDDIENIESSSAFEMMAVEYKSRWHHDVGIWNVQPPDINDKLDIRLFQKFRVHGELFVQQLINMSMIKTTQNLTEAMYQSLFQEFAAQFGLMSLSVPVIGKAQVDIGDKAVSSIPDIVFPDITNSDIHHSNLKILAVCEVKKEFKAKEDLVISLQYSTRSGKKKVIGKEQVIWHLDDRLQGQHGGELLLHYPLSQKNGLLGIIVQKTHVTFSYFQCNTVQFEEIMTGNQCVNSPVVYYSRPYNYLKAADRKELITPLLTLGFVQFSPCCISRKEQQIENVD